jgi:hypothetical protein
MITQDALNILGLGPDTTFEKIKAAWRKACFKFHPDRNPAGLEMIKMINEAYEGLKNYAQTDDLKPEESDTNYGEKINAALNSVMGLNIDIEICGAWVWLSGNTFAVKNTIKKAGFRFARKKKSWFYRPEKYKSRNRRTWDMSKIREKHGSKQVKQESKSEQLG